MTVRFHPKDLRNESAVARLTLEQAKEIYRSGEWSKCRCENLKPSWDLALFDAAVNIGQGRAVKIMQSAAGAMVDGFIGPKTIASVNAASLDALEKFLRLREEYYQTRPESLRKHYLTGWLNRVADVRKAVFAKHEAAS